MANSTRGVGRRRSPAGPRRMRSQHCATFAFARAERPEHRNSRFRWALPKSG